MDEKNCCCDASDCDDRHTEATAETIAEELVEATVEITIEATTEEPVETTVEVTAEDDPAEATCTCTCDNLIEEWKNRFKKGLDTLDNIIETELSEEKMKKALPFIIGAVAVGVAFALGMSLVSKKAAK